MKRTVTIGGWGNYPVAQVQEVAPARVEDCALHDAQPYLPRGLGRSYGDASLPAPAMASLNTRFLNHFLHFDPNTGILEAESGVSLADILGYFVPKGYFLPVTPGTKFVTLGGAVASNVHGKNHHHTGSIENFVHALRVRTPMGTFDCSRQERPDLFLATLSGYGLTGLIERVKLALRPIETAYFRCRNLPALDLDALFQLFAQHDQTSEFSVAWIDTLAKGRAMGRAVLFLGEHARLSDLDPRRTMSPLSIPPKTKFPVPFFAPSALLNPFSLSLFNQAIYLLKKQGQTEHLQDYDTFFYPLDAIHNWNRMYGARGFLQYQFIIPDPYGYKGISACLQFLSKHRIGSFLSVLKRYGDDHPLLPFAKKGYSLALDLPVRNDTLGLLDQLDALVLQFGGRVYLSKDARLSASTFRAMYAQEHLAWREAIATYNPHRTVWSAMAQRLEL